MVIRPSIGKVLRRTAWFAALALALGACSPGGPGGRDEAGSDDEGAGGDIGRAAATAGGPVTNSSAKAAASKEAPAGRAKILVEPAGLGLAAGGVKNIKIRYQANLVDGVYEYIRDIQLSDTTETFSILEGATENVVLLKEFELVPVGGTVGTVYGAQGTGFEGMTVPTSYVPFDLVTGTDQGDVSVSQTAALPATELSATGTYTVSWVYNVVQSGAAQTATNVAATIGSGVLGNMAPLLEISVAQRKSKVMVVEFTCDGNAFHYSDPSTAQTKKDTARCEGPMGDLFKDLRWGYATYPTGAITATVLNNIAAGNAAFRKGTIDADTTVTIVSGTPERLAKSMTMPATFLAAGGDIILVLRNLANGEYSYKYWRITLPSI